MKRALLLLPIVLMAGCVAGPNYRVPKDAMVQRPDLAEPFLGQKDAGATQQELPPHWWRLYDNPMLDAYVEEALAANADLRVAEANLRRASAVVQEAEAGRTVSTTVTGQGLGARTHGPGAALPGTFSYALGFDAVWSPDLAGSVHRGIEAASAQAEAAVAARDQVRVVVAAGVTRSYARICAANISLAAARRVAAIQQATLDVAERFARGGRGTRFDVDRARAAAHAADAALPDLLAQRRAALFELAALTGRPPADFPEEAETCSTIPTISRAIPVGDGAMLLRRRPDIRVAERELAAAIASIGVVESELYPKVSIGASAGSAASTDHLLAPSSFGFTLGPLLSWSFPNRQAVRARMAQAGADADASLARFDGAVLLALRQTETALSSYARARDRLEDLQSAAEAAGRASADAEKLQRFGRVAFLDLLTAQAAYAEAQASLSDARAALVDRQVDLFLALGGGWE
jgi:NodT family efflux transporter outer membrane factor (OMF) lipoprotein